MELPVGRAPHGVTVVDADVLPLLDVDSGPDHHPVVPVEVFAGVVDAGVLEDGDVGVECLGGGGSGGDLRRVSRSVRTRSLSKYLVSVNIENTANVLDLLRAECGLGYLEKLSDDTHHRGHVPLVSGG